MFRSLTTAIAVSTAAIASAGPLSEYNLIVAGNWTTGSNTWGRVAVGGSAAGNWTDVGTRLDRDASAGTDTLIVGGALSAGINLQAGNARIGGAFSGHINHNGDGTTATGVAGTSAYVGGLVDQVRGLSDSFAALSANSSLVMSSNHAVFDVANQSGTVVFSLDAASLSSSSIAQFSLANASSADAIVINVDASATGGQVNLTAGNFDASTFSAVADRLVWNFSNATDILVQRELFGSMIALDAHMLNQTNLNGSIAVGSFTQQGEVHGPNFNFSNPIPLPTTAAMAGLGLALVATRRRRA